MFFGKGILEKSRKTVEKTVDKTGLLVYSMDIK